MRGGLHEDLVFRFEAGYQAELSARLSQEESDVRRKMNIPAEASAKRHGYRLIMTPISFFSSSSVASRPVMPM